ncbi:MAG: hypothetical protein ACI9MJ_002617, partial [Alphaproteobacteria bacterium]
MATRTAPRKDKVVAPAAIKAATKIVTKAPVKAVTKIVAKAPAKGVTKASATAPTKASAKGATKAVTKGVTKASAKGATKAPSKAAIKALTKAAARIAEKAALKGAEKAAETASETAAEKDSEKESDAQDGPVIDSVDAAVKMLVQKGKERGFVTYDEFNAAMPSEEVGSEQIEDVMSRLSELGVNVVEDEETDEEAKPKEGGSSASSSSSSDDDLGRTDDPVRMYLREMGSVELLSREGEIIIAKRIEAGREKMISGLCGSPLTQRAVVRWYDALKEDLVLLRDVIDLDATYSGPPVDHSILRDKSLDVEVEETEEESDDDDDDDDGANNLSISMMEEALKPQVFEIFGNIADLYKKVEKLRVRQ